MLDPYREVLAIPRVRQAFLLGLLVRTPMAASFMILTLHVVGHLGGTYGQAGVLTMFTTVGAAISGPWRGRLLDRNGLRPTLWPSLVVLTVGWSIGPWVGFWPLVVVAFVTALFIIPIYSIVRQAMLTATAPGQHRTVLSLDAVGTEVSFIVGPAVGVLAATAFDTRIVLLVTQLLMVLGGVAMYVANLQLVGESAAASTAGSVPRREWFGLRVVAVLVAAVACTTILAGTEVSVVAAMRENGHQSMVGWVVALWSATSLIGGLVYGAMHRRVSVFAMIAVLSLATAPAALATSPVSAFVLLGIAGFAVAPALTSTTEGITAAVPEGARGEAMGFHGAALNIGSAVGSPLAGASIDAWGPPAGYLSVCVLGLVVAVAGGAAMRLRRARVGAA
ncbi:MFS transporter [Kribbia dieselivorans]|uniref:MFS transporter n=1 Tax=Kribbia dieselivorans TaxID=331526 RepID=UPI0012EE4937|nr:MFS transporter [Kribbia dieselivorans]